MVRRRLPVPKIAGSSPVWVGAIYSFTYSFLTLQVLFGDLPGIIILFA
jgi:hypothetical protein